MRVCKIAKAKCVAVTLNIMSPKMQFGVSAVSVRVRVAPFALLGGQDGWKRDASLRTVIHL